MVMAAALEMTGIVKYFASSDVLACNKVDFRVDKAGIVHAGIGKVSFGKEKLNENILAFVQRLIQLKPSARYEFIVETGVCGHIEI